MPPRAFWIDLKTKRMWKKGFVMCLKRKGVRSDGSEGWIRNLLKRNERFVGWRVGRRANMTKHITGG